MRYVLLVTISAFLLVGCGGDERVEPAETQRGTEWDGVAEPRPPGGELEVESFRRYAEAVDEGWERDAGALVREYLRIEGGVLTVEGRQVTLLRDGLEDDSVRAERWVLALSRDGEVWALRSARWEQRCHQGRGHQDFRNGLCL